jgi:hypothetical protein
MDWQAEPLWQVFEAHGVDVATMTPKPLQGPVILAHEPEPEPEPVTNPPSTLEPAPQPAPAPMPERPQLERPPFRREHIKGLDAMKSIITQYRRYHR